MSEKIWPEVRIKDWDHFDSLVASHRYRSWVYRGQVDSEWEVNSSLFRLYKDIKDLYLYANNRKRRLMPVTHEQLLIEKFKSHAHQYLTHTPVGSNDLEWLSVMQHFGTPTRLIDVSFTPYIALYFALEEKTCDAALYCLKPDHFKEIDKSEGDIDNSSENILHNHDSEKNYFIAYEPRMGNERLLAQQGLFLIPNSPNCRFEEILGDYIINEKSALKIIIPKERRLEGLKRLRKMNITSSVLFPGIDGFCRSLKGQVIESTQRLKRHS